MNLFDSFITGIGDVLAPNVLLIILVGSIIATIMGVIPVLGGPLIVTLSLPFIAGMDPMIVLPYLISLNAVSCTGGSMTSIMLNVPGDVVNAATMLDGYPMMKKGQGGRAIGAALTASVFGGVATVPLALLMIPLLLKFVMLIKAPETFLLLLLGLSCISVLSSKGYHIEGLISAALGILFSCIGAQAATGASRFTFDNVYLYQGIPVTIAVLGFFAIPAIIDMIKEKDAIVTGKDEIFTKDDRKQMKQGALDVWKYKWMAFRSMLVGYLVGVIPAIGAGASTFITYSMAKNSSRHPEEFGKGSVEGVIAPEAANNAKDAGALLTALSLGIPGSYTVALIMSALIVMGITPGPSMLTKQTALCITMLSSIAIANIFAGLLCWFFAPYLLRITRIKPPYMVAALLPLVVVGAYANSNFTIHIVIVLLLGIFSYFFDKYNYSRAAFLLGFILGGSVEYYFWNAIKLYGWPFIISSPISIVLFLLCLLVVFNRQVSSLFKKVFTKSVVN